MTLQTPAHQYTVKGVKSFRGMEGYGFNATLYNGSKRIAFVIDEGRGGGLLFRYFDMANGKVAEEQN